jgi:alpha-tubulin suppressor-like RCC1 family protein
VAEIPAGAFHGLALRDDGTVSAWGDERFGQTSVPEQLKRSLAVEVAAGNVHNLARLRNGTVVAWGPSGGQLGDYAQCGVPAWLKGVAAVAAGAVHSLALRRDGTVLAWGLDTAGHCDVPPGLSNVVAIAARGSHSMVLINDRPSPTKWAPAPIAPARNISP